MSSNRSEIDQLVKFSKSFNSIVEWGANRPTGSHYIVEVMVLDKDSELDMDLELDKDLVVGKGSELGMDLGNVNMVNCMRRDNSNWAV